MTDTHIIRLRGGWRQLAPAPEKICSLPIQVLELDDLNNHYTLARAFNRPPSAGDHLTIHLCWNQTPSMVRLSINPGESIEQPPASGKWALAEGINRYILTIEFQADRISDQLPWGHFWLELQDPS
jgi:hypothetical protein